MSKRSVRNGLASFALTITMTALTVISVTAHAMKINRVYTAPGFPGHVKVVVQPVSSVDVLFVVDNSGSMGSHQANLAANIPLFTQALNANKLLNVQAGVMTSDMDSRSGDDKTNGRLVGGPKIATNAMPDFETVLARNLQVGVVGAADEQFFSPVVTGLSSPIYQQYNNGFLRPNAHLAVILVTDTDDQSKATPSEFAQFLTNLKGGRDMMSLYAFHIPSADLNCGRSGEQLPIKLEESLQILKGKSYSLCSADFGKHLSEIGDHLQRTMIRTVPLLTEPALDTIEVTYGSMKLVRGDSRLGWVYDSTENSVVVGDLIDWNTQPAGTNLEVKFIPKKWQN